MPITMQEFLAGATQKASADLEAALLRLPEDKRNWSPQSGSRSALNQVAECAIMSQATAQVLTTHTFPADFSMETFMRTLSELSLDENAALALLHEKTALAVAAIGAVPETDLGVEVIMPWGAMTLQKIMAYPLWNLSYHEGQINYIASLLPA